MLDKARHRKIAQRARRGAVRREVERAVDLFQTDCYWRDLVTFTWNIKTMEGKEQVQRHAHGALKPSNWKIADGEEHFPKTDGIIESWIQFETEVARGFGHRA